MPTRPGKAAGEELHPVLIDEAKILASPRVRRTPEPRGWIPMIEQEAASRESDAAGPDGPGRDDRPLRRADRAAQRLRAGVGGQSDRQRRVEGLAWRRA